MKVYQTPLEGAWIVNAEPFRDNRGEFARWFCLEELEGIIQGRSIKQINYSKTTKRGSIRGMHFQYPPKCESKLVRCIKGSVFDVIIDLREGSDTYLKWFGEILSMENMKMLFIPEGFAHGFQTLAPNSEMLYLHSELYSPEYEGTVRYDDPLVGITWPMEKVDISTKDANHSLIKKDFKGIKL
jgi:dTDP-4-dehydrorhamnose 3,5-epimerase